MLVWSRGESGKRTKEYQEHFSWLYNPQLLDTYEIWQYDGFRSYKTLTLLPGEFWKHTRDSGIINIYKLKEMVVSEVCGQMVTKNRHPHMQWLMSLMWHMWLNSKYTYPSYRSAKITIKLCFCLGDLFPVLPEVCTLRKYFFPH